MGAKIMKSEPDLVRWQSDEGSCLFFLRFAPMDDLTHSHNGLIVVD